MISRNCCLSRRGVALACLLLTLGCRSSHSGSAASSRGSEAEAASAPAIFAPGVISDAREQWRITFTADNNTAYFSSSDAFFPISRKATIFVSHRKDDVWSTPTVASFSGKFGDIDPHIAPDGQRLYFSSIRPIDGVLRGDLDIWYVERTSAGWGDPTPLGSEVNSPSDELYPSVSSNGTLYFASGPLFPQPGKHFDIYAAAKNGRSFAPREALSVAINTAPVAGGGLQDAWEFNPEISVDGQTLLFTSLRPGGFGLGDLYVSTLQNGAWLPARNIGPSVNTAADEYHPTLSRDKRTLHFVRRSGSNGDFYRVSVGKLLARLHHRCDFRLSDGCRRRTRHRRHSSPSGIPADSTAEGIETGYRCIERAEHTTHKK